jgi:LacI family transcriptional regulator
VVGFDNLEIISTLLHPTLSSIELPHYQMGQWAVNYLLGNVPESEVGKPIQQRIPCPYIERQSV